MCRYAEKNGCVQNHADRAGLIYISYEYDKSLKICNAVGTEMMRKIAFRRRNIEKI